MINSSPENAASVYPAQVIKASAGSGKTFQLSNHYLKLLLCGVPPQSILAATFTRKAAAEIKLRILERLIEAAVDQKKRTTLATELCIDLSQARLVECLQKLLTNLQQLEISTLDAFIVKLCLVSTTELGLLPGWQLMDGQVDFEIRRHALKAVLTEINAPDMQLLVTEIRGGKAVRSVAIALLNKIMHMHKLFRSSITEAWFCKELPIAELDRKKIQSSFLSIQSFDIPQTAKGQPDKNWVKAKTKLLDALKSYDTEEILKNSLVGAVVDKSYKYSRHGLSEPLISELEKLIPLLAGAVRYQTNIEARALLLVLGHYDQFIRILKKKANSYSFDDLKELFAASTFCHNLEQIYYRIDTRIQHVLLDEFQDTALAEWQVLQPLVAEILAKADDNHSFFCVGDMKQAIYGWRGGVAEIFNQISNNWSNVKEVPLNKSYRSSPIVIEFVNSIFTNLENTFIAYDFPEILKTWAKIFTVHDTTKVELSGYVNLVEYDSERSSMPELAVLEEKLNELISSQEKKSIGILLRNNRSVASIVRYLRARYPTVSINDEGNTALSQSTGVALIYSLLHFIEHPTDTIALMHIKNSPLAKDLRFSALGSKEQNYQVALNLHRQLIRESLSQFIEPFVRILEQHLSLTDYRHLQQFRLLVHSYPKNITLRLSDFVRWAKSQKTEDAELSQIRVMTIHGSKGLEFDAVFLPGLSFDLTGNSQAFNRIDILRETALGAAKLIVPRRSEHIRAVVSELQAAYSSEQQGVVNESLCLLYVALTRAKQGLYISMPKSSPNSKSRLVSKLIKQALMLDKTEMQENFEKGQPNWYMHKPIEADFKSKTKNDAFIYEDTNLTFSTTTKSCQRSHVFVAASQLHRDASALKIVELVKNKQHTNFSRGIALHRIFQSLTWLDEQTLDINKILVELGISDETVTEFKSIIKGFEIQQLFLKRRYTEQGIEVTKVYQELPMLIRHDELIVNGAIDRLVVGKSADNKTYLEVIDFKSDHFDGNNQSILNAIIKNYEPQIKLYAEAAAKIMQVDPTTVHSKLAFVSFGKVVTI